MTDIKYSGMNYSIKPSLHVSSRILIVNDDFPCKMIRLQISCQLEIWLANARSGWSTQFSHWQVCKLYQTPCLLSGSVSEIRVCSLCQSGSALHHLWVYSGSASLFGDSPSRIGADTESRPWVWLVPAFCLSYIWLVLHTCTNLVVANPQTCKTL